MKKKKTRNRFSLMMLLTAIQRSLCQVHLKVCDCDSLSSEAVQICYRTIRSKVTKPISDPTLSVAVILHTHDVIAES